MIKEPKANDVLHICQLITGDRFFCKSDNSKEVWELRFHTLIRVRGEFKKLSQCRNDTGEVKRYDANRVVIFLRRTKPLVRNKKVFSIERYFA